VLHRQGLTELFESDPGGAIASLHRAVTAGEPDPDALFALSELSFRHAQDTGNHAYYLAAAVYAFAFLFPDDPAQRPSAFDPRFRTASDLYNRSLTSAFASADRSRVLLRSGRYELPFGSIDVTFDPATARWDDLALSEFTPADELHIKGLQVRYRQRGIGAPLAADATAAAAEKEFQVAPEVKVPVTALLRIDFSRRNLAQGHLRGTVDVYPAFEPRFVTIRGQSVPLEVDPSAAIAYSLNDSKVWESEFAGFLDGNFFDRSATQLLGLEPYRPGQIPVVFIHGTGSSPGRWADLINDLQSDPVIRGGFQFWSFSYATGNPTAFSAMELRTAIEDAVHKVDPLGRDPALQRIVLIGHSQGGLLAKWLTIDSGSRLWDTVSSKLPEALRLSAENAALARRVMFVTPLPQVRRVIFIATPQHGSLVAESPIGQFLARLATPRDRILTALRDLTENNPDVLRFDPGSARFGSVWDMSPDNPFVKAFAAIPVSPKVAAHSIIAVEGDGPAETGDDGVVTYQSAHIPEAKSELVVRSGHSVQANPQTVGEIRRILLLHLAEAYRQDSVPVAKTDRLPLADHCCGG
jgi:pimeloyl-ACP methyl ester carboxylesterase